MKVTYDVTEFFRVTGVIRDQERLKQLGFDVQDWRGNFRPEEMEDVLHFCAVNPEFHIVTYLDDGVYINRYDARGGLFRVADGDKTPDYMLNVGQFIKWTLNIR